MDYLSDDEEKKDEQELTFDEMYPDEEMDDELKQIIFNNTVEHDYSILAEKQKEKKKKEKKVKQIVTLEDALKEDEKNKPKKWTSAKAEAKKPAVKELKPKRQFRPRLPPYRSVHKLKEEKEVIDICDNKLFPSL
ncbi:MAG: hypothetical protein EBT45_08540 [Alphaproteobacteria bacterium]|nr:hypothetical protein [Alphaproteobacteria bacterium]